MGRRNDSYIGCPAMFNVHFRRGTHSARRIIAQLSVHVKFVENSLGNTGTRFGRKTSCGKPAPLWTTRQLIQHHRSSQDACKLLSDSQPRLHSTLLSAAAEASRPRKAQHPLANGETIVGLLLENELGPLAAKERNRLTIRLTSWNELHIRQECVRHDHLIPRRWPRVFARVKVSGLPSATSRMLLSSTHVIWRSHGSRQTR